MQQYIEDDLQVSINNPVTRYPVEAERDLVRRQMIAIASRKDVLLLLQAACWAVQFVPQKDLSTLNQVLMPYQRGVKPPSGNGSVLELIEECRRSGERKVAKSSRNTVAIKT